MKNYIENILKCSLFANIERDNIGGLLSCLNAKTKTFQKNNIIILAGDPADKVGIILEGEAQVVREDAFGTRSIISGLAAGDMFGEAYACAGVAQMPVSVMANCDCVTMFIDYMKIINKCKNYCRFHEELVNNMLRILAVKNINLNKKNAALSARTTRKKLMAYLSSQAEQSGNRIFYIPFNRQELADYLSVDRSAMSSELSRMSDEGLISFEKNKFELLKPHKGD